MPTRTWAALTGGQPRPTRPLTDRTDVRIMAPCPPSPPPLPTSSSPSNGAGAERRLGPGSNASGRSREPSPFCPSTERTSDRLLFPGPPSGSCRAGSRRSTPSSALGACPSAGAWPSGGSGRAGRRPSPFASPPRSSGPGGSSAGWTARGVSIRSRLPPEGCASKSSSSSSRPPSTRPSPSPVPSFALASPTSSSSISTPLPTRGGRGVVPGRPSSSIGSVA